MKYYLTTEKIQKELEMTKTEAQRLFRQAKSKAKWTPSNREVPARLVNEIIGYKAFETPQEEV